MKITGAVVVELPAADARDRGAARLRLAAGGGCPPGGHVVLRVGAARVDRALVDWFLDGCRAGSVEVQGDVGAVGAWVNALRRGAMRGMAA